MDTPTIPPWGMHLGECKKMATIKTIGMKGWVDRTTGKPEFTLEVSIDYDYLPLSADQEEALKKQTDQLKGLLENQLMTWKDGADGEFKTADKVNGNGAGQKTLTPLDKGAKLKSSDDPVNCSVCGEPTEEKKSAKGVAYRYCPKCRDNRQRNGKPFPPRGGN